MVVRYLPNATASEELYHHGVDDQKWGVRHGPPYPLDPSPAKQAIRKKKSVGLIQHFKNKRKGKKLREAKERKKKEREEIDKAVKAGNAAKIEKLQSKMSDEDLVKAINRLNLSQSVSTLKTAESMRRMEKGKAFLSTSANIAMSAANIVESVSRAKSAIDKITGKANSDEDSVLKALKKELDYSKTQNDMSKNVLDKLKNERLVKLLNDTNTSKETINNILGISKGGKGVSEERVRELIEELSHSDVDELYHFGVQGQKWGIRRYQNPDGSLTDAGRKHYGVNIKENKYIDSKGIAKSTDIKTLKKALLKSEERVVNANYRLKEAKDYIKKNKDNPNKTVELNNAKEAERVFEKEIESAKKIQDANIAKAMKSGKDVIQTLKDRNYVIKGEVPKDVFNSAVYTSLGVAASHFLNLPLYILYTSRTQDIGDNYQVVEKQREKPSLIYKVKAY